MLQDEDNPQQRHATNTIYLLMEYINLLNIFVYKNTVTMSSDRETCILWCYEFQTVLFKPVTFPFGENNEHSEDSRSFSVLNKLNNMWIKVLTQRDSIIFYMILKQLFIHHKICQREITINLDNSKMYFIKN